MKIPSRLAQWKEKLKGNGFNKTIDNSLEY